MTKKYGVDIGISRRSLVRAGLELGISLSISPHVFADKSPELYPQPYFSGVMRTISALEKLGAPISHDDNLRIMSLAEDNSEEGILVSEEILQKYTLLNVYLEEDGAGKTTLGKAPRDLVEQGWRCFLVRIENPQMKRCSLQLSSQNAMPEGEIVQRRTSNSSPNPSYNASIELAGQWLGYSFFSKPPLSDVLSGFPVEYGILQLFSRDRGRRKTRIMVGCKAHYRIIAFRFLQQKTVAADFNCLPSHDVLLDIKDWDGEGCTAALFIKDKVGRIYPAPSHRLEPDFDFQPQVYRADGESVRLPPGHYAVESWRGPEYIRSSQNVYVDESGKSEIKVKLRRWINPPMLGWYPGDSHVHASGCSHYESPTVGASPETMIRHIRGEGLSVGEILIWRPGYYHQKNFFTGQAYQPKNVLEHPELQRANNTSLKPRVAPHDNESTVRYDMEVSGFPSSHFGHLALFRLRELNYPNASRVEEWPTWNLPILKWAKAQEAVVGYAHCGWGLATEETALPNYAIPDFDSVGANEYLIDVAHGMIDFLSGVEATAVSELNIWYHTLNCGFRVAMLGETDFPCLADERVGIGRSYVGLPKQPAGNVGYNNWIQGVKDGRLYCGDGRSHLIDYSINDVGVGDAGVELSKPGVVKIKAKIAARLEEEEEPVGTMWHLERARIKGTRNVDLEVVMNGRTVENFVFPADGSLWDFSTEIHVDKSSWVALRILSSSHTNPIFINVAGAPIRASKKSAQWCVDCVDAMWKKHSERIKKEEFSDAESAYLYAREVYLSLVKESVFD